MYLFLHIAYLLGVGSGGCKGPHCTCLGSCLQVSRWEGDQFTMVPTPGPFGLISARWPWGRRKPRCLEFALHLPWGSACLASTFRGLDFWAVSHLFIAILSPSEPAVQGWVPGTPPAVKEMGAYLSLVCRWGYCTWFRETCIALHAGLGKGSHSAPLDQLWVQNCFHI